MLSPQQGTPPPAVQGAKQAHGTLLPPVLSWLAAWWGAAACWAAKLGTLLGTPASRREPWAAEVRRRLRERAREAKLSRNSRPPLTFSSWQGKLVYGGIVLLAAAFQYCLGRDRQSVRDIVVFRAHAAV